MLLLKLQAQGRALEGRLEREGSWSEEGLESQPSLGDGSVRKWVGAQSVGQKAKHAHRAALLSDRWQLCRTVILLITAGLAASQDKGANFNSSWGRG